MDIGTQNANQIFNVNGNAYFENSPEVISLLNKEKQKKLSEINSISYFALLEKEYSKKKIIKRRVEIERIKRRLDEKRQVMLHGEPGLGKTTNLFQLAIQLENLTYISVKSKSPISIITHLINSIRLSSNEDLVEIENLDEGVDWLQSNLQKSNQYFIIDDCEQNIEVVFKIVSLHKFENKFLFATRNKIPFEPSGISFYPSSSFSSEEVSEFLQLHGLNPGMLEFNDIFRASQGNPLYLYYFSQFQISPLPESLTDYQNSIWSGLNANQQEILALTAIPYFDISIVELSQVLGFESVSAFSVELDNLSPLVNNFNGNIELFHPSFRDFVLERIQIKGLLDHYKEKLGIFYLAKEEIIQAIFLLIDIAPDKVDKYLLDAFPDLVSWGELDFALKVLKSKLTTANTDFEKGYLYYHLCQVNNLLGRKEDATICIDQSLEYLKKTENKTFTASALMFKAMNLIDRGNVAEATIIADQMHSTLKEFDQEFRAVLLVSLSKIYIDLSEFDKGAVSCIEAFENFDQIGSRSGMINSLVNLVSCLTQMDGHLDEAEKYGLRVLEVLDSSSEFSIKIILFNTLASVYREKRVFDKAKEFSGKAIDLCHQFGMKDKVVLNLINYGNILREEGRIEEAKKIYDEALLKAKEYRLKRDEGRIYWILSGISRKEGDFELSIDFADRSISASKEVNYYFGVANALKEKSKTYGLMSEPIKAAEALVESAEFFGRVKQFAESSQYYISKAINIYSNLGEKEKANSLINRLLESISESTNIQSITSLILDNSNEKTISENFSKLFYAHFSNVNSTLNIIRSFFTFIEYCNSLDPNKGNEIFRDVIFSGIKKIGQSKFSFSVLGIAIEQSGNLLGFNDLKTISIMLQEKLSFFSLRELDDDVIFITTIASKINLEIHTIADEVSCYKLAIALVLLLNERPELVIGEHSLLENSCELRFYTYLPALRKIMGQHLSDLETIFKDGLQTSHFIKSGYNIPDGILVHPDYEINNSLFRNPENKVSLYFFATTIMKIKSHFYHSDVEADDIQRRSILYSVAKLFDYSNTDGGLAETASRFEIDIDKI